MTPATSLRERLRDVKMIVGTDDPATVARGGGPATNEQQNHRFRQILRQLGIKYQESPIIQLFNLEAVTGVAGSLRVFLTALTCAHVPVLSSYQGEPAKLLKPPPAPACQTLVISTFFEVAPALVDKALRTLRRLDLSNPEAKLCLTSENVAVKCRCRKNIDSSPKKNISDADGDPRPTPKQSRPFQVRKPFNLLEQQQHKRRQRE